VFRVLRGENILAPPNVPAQPINRICFVVGAVIEIDRNGEARLSAKPFAQIISTNEIEAALQRVVASPTESTLVGRAEGWYQVLF
jgi:hypothetical protein